MTNRLYVGNLSFSATEEVISRHFAACGDVASVAVITDRETGQPRGFAFVDMATEAAANKAVTELNGKELQGRSLRVNIAEDRGGGRGPGGGGRGPGGGGGRGGGNGRRGG
ncbi:MAG: RNA-binding protein [Kofleriaceae bacterium]|nr:RNA-binding protein [Kofleriaceae bacterium]